MLLPCGDDYESLPEKVQEIIRYNLANDFDFMVKVDDDTIVLPEQFLASGFEQYDFVGRNNPQNRRTPSGSPWGFFYVLSRRAMEIMANAELPTNHNDEAWVASTLAKHGIFLHHEDRLCLHGGIAEDFIGTKHTLRCPVKAVTHSALPPAVPGTFAWCMYIEWLGYRKLSDERNIEEMCKVFSQQ